jgi:hypothetical protein
MFRSTIVNNAAGGTDYASPYGGVLAWEALSAINSVIINNTAKYGGGVLAGNA